MENHSPIKTNADLIHQASKENVDALNDVCTIYRPMIMRLLRSKGVQQEDAEDVAQEVLSVLMSLLPEFEYDANKTFRGFVRRIGELKLHEYWRARQKNKVTESFGLGYLQNTRNSDEIEHLIKDNSKQVKIVALIRTAREKARSQGWNETTWQAWELNKLHGLKPQEVSKLLGIKANTVSVCAHRVFKLIRETAEENQLDFDSIDMAGARMSQFGSLCESMIRKPSDP